MASDSEKAGNGVQNGHADALADIPDDPDAHLSEKEKEAIVRLFTPHLEPLYLVMPTADRVLSKSGAQSYLAPGSHPDSLGKSRKDDILPFLRNHKS